MKRRIVKKVIVLSKISDREKYKNIRAGTIHNVIHPKDKPRLQKGVWVMGNGVPVILLPWEYKLMDETHKKRVIICKKLKTN